MRNVAEHQVGALPAQQIEPGRRALGLQQLRTTPLRQPRRLPQLARQGADDEEAGHQPPPPLEERSDLMISVIVTPRRLSSTITTSPRATRRLLT